MEDSEVWETSKENILPIRSGRNTQVLKEVLEESVDDRPVRSHLHNEEDEIEFERQLQEDSDCLDTWVRYISYTKQHNPTRQRIANALIERALENFKNNESVKNDERYARMCIEYADQADEDPVIIMQTMHREGIGTDLALYYTSFASILEKQGNYRQADEVYQEGLRKMAYPVERLRRYHDQFKERTAECDMDDGNWLLDENEGDEKKRSAFGGIRESKTTKEVSSYRPMRSGEYKRNKFLVPQDQEACAANDLPSFVPFEDDNLPAHQDPFLSGKESAPLVVGIRRRKENDQESVPWCDYQVAQKESTVPAEPSGFAVFNDFSKVSSHLEKPNRANNSNNIQGYNIDLLSDGNGNETCFEEHRAQAFLSRLRQNVSQKSQNSCSNSDLQLSNSSVGTPTVTINTKMAEKEIMSFFQSPSLLDDLTQTTDPEKSYRAPYVDSEKNAFSIFEDTAEAKEPENGGFSIREDTQFSVTFHDSIPPSCERSSNYSRQFGTRVVKQRETHQAAKLFEKEKEINLSSLDHVEKCSIYMFNKNAAKKNSQVLDGFLRDVETNLPLHRGQYATLYKAEIRNRAAVVKVPSEKYVSMLENEFYIMKMIEERNLNENRCPFPTAIALNANEGVLARSYVEGYALRDIVQGYVSQFRVMDEILVMHYAKELLQLVEELHGTEILHLNIDQNRVIVSPKGELSLVGFGESVDLTLYTPNCRLMKETDGQTVTISSKTDLYSVGAIIYSLLYGEELRDVNQMKPMKRYWRTDVWEMLFSSLLLGEIVSLGQLLTTLSGHLESDREMKQSLNSLIKNEYEQTREYLKKQKS